MVAKLANMAKNVSKHFRIFATNFGKKVIFASGN